MATQKPISTISYNTEDFLKEKLEQWIKARKIQAYQYICHKGEDGDKDHIHLRLEPNKALDQMELSEELRQYPAGHKKPLGVRPFRPSKEEDWYLYVTHDPTYMKMKYADDKCEKIPYDYTKIQVSEFYDLETAWVRAKASLKHTSASLMDELRKGKKPMDLVSEGANPFITNAVYKSLYASNYSKLAAEYEKLQIQLHDLLNAIDEYGLVPVVNDFGKTILERIDCPFTEGDAERGATICRTGAVEGEKNEKE